MEKINKYLWPVTLKAIIFNLIKPKDSLPLKFFHSKDIMRLDFDSLNLPRNYFKIKKTELAYEITAEEESNLYKLDEYFAHYFVTNNTYTLDKFLLDDFEETWKIIKNYLFIEYDETKSELVKNILNDYIDKFSKDELEKLINYYSINKHIYLLPKIFGEYYDSYGPNISISENFYELKNHFSEENNLNINEIKEKFRLYELLLYLMSKGYIKLNDCYFIERNNPDFNILDKVADDITKYEFMVNFSFIKSPDEIYDIENYWIFYGDLRANEKDKIAFYKTNRYPFQSTKHTAFKLLCRLIKNHGKKIPIDELYNTLDSDDINRTLEFKDKKQIITDLRKYIMDKLQITKDKNPTITITISGKHIILISNPPIAY